jgi:hypothetical protein
MRGIWLRSVYIDRTLLIGTLLLLLIAEAMVIVAFAVSPKMHPSFGIDYLLGSVFITCIPGVAGIKGYYMVRRLRSTLDVKGEDTTAIWLSRHFLGVTVFAYGAVIVNIMLLTEQLRPK